jgi:hypothetical protein
MKPDPPRWFALHAAVVFTSSGFQAATRDGDLARAYLQLMSWNWSQGAFEVAREHLGRMLGVDDATISMLALHGIVRESGSDRVVASLDWLDDARSEAIKSWEKKKRAGNASAELRRRHRQDPTGSAVPTPIEQSVNSASTVLQQQEERTGDETSPPSLVPVGAVSSPPTDDAHAPDQGGRSKARPKRVAETWQAVLERPEYEPLRRNSEFMGAWAQWTDWCATPGAKARLPVAMQAAKMLNRAFEDPGLYSRAIAFSIEHNYKGVNPDWLERDGRRASDERVPKGQRAAMRAIAFADLPDASQLNGGAS